MITGFEVFGAHYLAAVQNDSETPQNTSEALQNETKHCKMRRGRYGPRPLTKYMVITLV